MAPRRFHRVAGRRAASRVFRPAHLTSVLALAGVLATLPGCGSSSSPKTNGIPERTATEAFEAAKQAAATASSVAIHGTSQAGGGRLRLDLQLNRRAGKGKITLLGTEFEVIRVGQALYVNGPRSLYAQLGIKKQIPNGGWVKLPAQNSLAALISLPGETTRIISASAVTKGTTTTVEGQPALELKTEGKLYKGRLYIKTTGQPYPIKLEKQGRETAQITFTGWDEPVTITAPTTSSIG